MICAATHHRLEEVAVLLGDLADVDTDANLDGALRVVDVVLVQRALDGGGGGRAATVDGEGDEKPATQGLAHTATESDDLVVHEIVACKSRMSSASWSPRARRRALVRQCRSS